MASSCAPRCSRPTSPRAPSPTRSASRGRAIAAGARAIAFLVAPPLLSLAVLLPRIDAIQASSLAAGYERIGDALGALGGSDGGSLQANGVWAAWPLAFGAAPGAYAGATILLCVPLALRARRRRVLSGPSVARSCSRGR